MGFLFYYTTLIRVVIILITVVQIFKKDYKKIFPALISIVLSFVPWLLSLINIKITTLTGVLYQTVIFMAPFLGSGLKFYDLIAWWDRAIHILSGILSFGFGITLAEKAPDAGLAGSLIFSFTLSLALHVIWEVAEFILDSIFHTDHQHWQKHSSTVNHQPDEAIQPPGLVDTMVDTIAGIIGAIIACVGWWIYMIS